MLNEADVTGEAGQGARVRLRLLGAVELWGGRARVRPEASTALLLARLALEPGVGRAALAAQLWPDSAPATARGNVRQLLRRLHVACGRDALVCGQEVLELAPGAEVDVLRLRAQLAPGAAAGDPALWEGELLPGVSAPEGGELERWLRWARAAVAEWQQRARRQELGRLEAAGELPRAARLAEAWARAEPASEAALHWALRLQRLAGQRAEALHTFERFRAARGGAALRPETLALVEDLRAGGAAPAGAPRPLPSLAPRLAAAPAPRTPVLVGRAEARARLEAAWAAGGVVLVTGEAGVGKSRLADEVARARGARVRVEGRPGDRGVPYASLSRALRTLLAARPDAGLPTAVRQQLARLLPELRVRAAGPAAPGAEADAGARTWPLLRAAAAALGALTQGLGTLLVEDLHLWDAHSVRAGAFWLEERAARGAVDAPRVVLCCRSGEPGAHRLARLAAAAGCVVALAPLDEADVRRLAEALGGEGLAAHARALWRHTGGNPLFVEETARQLLEAGADAGTAWPAHLPTPARLRPLLARRLARLPGLQRQLVQVAALVGPGLGLGLDVALAARVLGEAEAHVARALGALEREGWLARGGRLPGLLRAAVAEGLGEAQRAALHAQLAHGLAAGRAGPLVVAEHLLAAGEERAAAAWLLRAAETARAAGLHEDALRLCARAAGTLAPPDAQAAPPAAA